MYDNDEKEPVEEFLAAQPATGFSSRGFPSKPISDDDEEDNPSYVRGYN